jgi:hypothetical protein
MKILCIDFDGVIHSYSSGWQGADVASDPPVPGAIEFLHQAVRHFKVMILSSRSDTGGGIMAMKEFLYRHAPICGPDIEWTDLIEFPLSKPPAFLTIDDRALTFTGTWPSIEALLAFKPWYAK